MDAKGYYATHGIGGRVGFGRRPAILVIDIQNDFSHLGLRPARAHSPPEAAAA